LKIVDVGLGWRGVVRGKEKGTSFNGFGERVWVENGGGGVGHDDLTTFWNTVSKDLGSNVGLVMGKGGSSGVFERG